tara:strand:- start:11567 stop:11830 length:264 start_codon:yes stop_codon:yes gene_type:complete
MTESRELSDLKLTREECPKCGATWINGNHVWKGTGNEGNELDLAGLVCNKLGDENCINPLKGFEGGQTWEARSKRIETLEKLQEEDL